MWNKSTILIVDDTISNLDILAELLIEYDVIETTNAMEALEIIVYESIDLILLDIMMPDIDGYEMCSILKNNSQTKDIPVIFLTSKTDEIFIEKAYDIGGIDYITKPFKPKELLARVKTQLDNQRLIKELDYLATRDTMTGVYNRRKFFELAMDSFEKEKILHVVMIDIDNFKPINDNYGHPVGDKVIKLVAQTIDESLLDNTIFGRIGGEEFTAVYINLTKDEVIQDIELIRRKISNLELIEGKDSIKFTISNGIASKNSDLKSLDELLKIADDALYEAKNSGRNRVIFRN